ncbi:MULTISPECIES: hypothetical protein [unclassified Microbacterium]|uniref:hypothetical protein n=1 Tax=unclassified Microbacterium TaxID=2609290 RepID=UPI0034247E76
MKNTSEFSRGLIATAVTLSLVTTANSAAAQTDGGTDHAEVFASYIVAQANLAQGDSPKSCLFFTAAPIPGVIWRIKC